MATFSYTASIGASVSYSPKVRTTQFGDGYELRLAYGLNTRAEVWDLTFNGKSTSDADDIDDFLKARNSVEAFDWTSPSGTVGKFVCRSWSRTIDEPNVETLTARFEQVFDAT
jgi:phage-related protein